MSESTESTEPTEPTEPTEETPRSSWIGELLNFGGLVCYSVALWMFAPWLGMLVLGWLARELAKDLQK